jgi:plastocyanin
MHLHLKRLGRPLMNKLVLAVRALAACAALAVFARRFTKVGTYRILCTLHDGMRLRLTVR